MPPIQNTSSYWGLRIILRHHYGWSAPIEQSNWKKLDGMIRERANDRNWPREVLVRAGIERSGTELARRGNGSDDDRLQFSLEWGFFTRCQWGEFDTALYELERCWGKSPESPAPIGAGPRPATEQTIKSLDDVHQAVAHYVESIPYDRIISTATHLSTDIDYRMRDRWRDGGGDRAAKSSGAGRAGLLRVVCQRALPDDARGTRRAARVSVQLRGRAAAVRDSQPAFAADDRASRRDDRTAPEAEVSVLPWLSRHANQSMCTLVRELPNLSLAGYWWHNFFPSDDRTGDARADRDGAGQQADWVLLRRVLRGVVVCQGRDHAEGPGERAGPADRAWPIRSQHRPWHLRARSCTRPRRRCSGCLRVRVKSK